MGKKILLMDTAYSMAEKRWDELAAKYDVELVECTAKNGDEFLEYFQNDDVFMLANTLDGAKAMGRFPANVVERLPPGLKVVCHEGCGYDTLGDMSNWKKKNIIVSNTPESVIRATADAALYLTLGTLRNFNALSQSLRDGNWRGGIALADDSVGKTLGIIGLGSVGSLARDKITAALDFDKVQYFSRRRAAPEIEKDSVHVDLDTLLSTSDVILICVPLTASTHHLINSESLKKCKDGVFLINTARGQVIDEQALVDALKSGKVKSVGLDVFEHEPAVHPDLVANKNALLLPHVGPHTIGSIRGMKKEFLDNVEEYIRTGKVINLVPELQ